MTFYCNTSSWMEALSGPETVKELGGTNWNTWSAKNSLYGPEPWGKGASYRSHRLFIELVEQYTRRNLRFDSDALRAFAGITQRLQRSDPPIYNYAGLPFVPWSDLDARAKLVSLALSSELYGSNRPPERRTAFPSWTWAGWKSSAVWDEKGLLSGLDEYSCPVHNIYFESSSPPGTMASVRSNLSQDFLDGVCAIHLDIPMVLPKYLITSASMHGFYRLDSISEKIEDWCSVTTMEFLDNLAEGIWSCFLLGYQKFESSGYTVYNAFLLFVEWQDERTAVRIGGTWYQNTALSPQVIETLKHKTIRLV